MTPLVSDTPRLLDNGNPVVGPGLCEALQDITRAVCREWQGRDAALRELTEAGARTLDVARVSVWIYDDDRALLHCLDLFDGSTGTHSLGLELPRERFPTYFRALDEARVIDAADAHADPRTGEFSGGYLDVHGIGAMLDAPVWIAGELAGVVCHEHVGGSRAWSPEEEAFAVSLGNLTSLVLETSRLQEAKSTLESRESLLAAVGEDVAGRTGADYFASVVKLIGAQLNADLAFVGELTEDDRGIRTLAAWRDGAPAPDFEYDLAGSPCRTVVGGFSCTHPSGVSELFPQDRGLVAMQAQGYVGAPLMSSEGTPMGLLVAVFKDPLSNTTLPESVLRIFAARAAGEVERIHVEADRSQLEAALLRAQRLESVGKLAGGIAHDFNNLLAPIVAYAEMGLESLSEEHELREDLQEIIDAADRASRLTRQLLAFGRQQVLEKKTLDLNRLVEAFRGMIRPVVREDINFVLDLHDGPLYVFADSGQLEQVLMNLVLNAQQAMPDGGLLNIRTRCHTVPQAGDPDCPDLAPGSFVHLSVSDSGIGIDDETAAHLFEPFFTTKGESDGTGLGLATVYGIVQQHGGAIHFRTHPDEGTQFDVFLPGSEEAFEKDEAKPVSTVQPGNERILVVEDEEAVRRLVVTVLERNGYRVLQADGPAAALDLVERDDLEFDLVLTDVVMPGMNGVELYKRISRERPGTKVLYMSGYAHEVVAGKGLDESINLLPKPFSVKVLTSRVRATLDS